MNNYIYMDKRSGLILLLKRKKKPVYKHGMTCTSYAIHYYKPTEQKFKLSAERISNKSLFDNFLFLGVLKNV